MQSEMSAVEYSVQMSISCKVRTVILLSQIMLIVEQLKSKQNTMYDPDKWMQFKGREIARGSNPGSEESNQSNPILAWVGHIKMSTRVSENKASC
jgi:hypothetical protein